MSLNHICEGGLVDLDLDVKSLKIQGQEVGDKALSLSEASYSNLDLTGIKNVFLDAGPSTVISGVGGLVDGQQVTFMTCQQASSITIQNSFSIKTPGATDIVLNGVGGVAQGTFSSALGYLTVVKTS